MKNFTCTQVQGLLDKYLEKKGIVITIAEGCLGYGTMIATGEKLKTAIIQEYFINEWTSGHSITLYNKCPKKYLKYINN